MLALLTRRAMRGMLDAVEHFEQRSLCSTDHVTVVEQLELCSTARRQSLQLHGRTLAPSLAYKT